MRVGSVEYRGFRIHTRKKPGFPFYYAWVYSVEGNIAGIKVDSDDEPAGSRERIIEIAKYKIDEGIIAK